MMMKTVIGWVAVIAVAAVTLAAVFSTNAAGYWEFKQGFQQVAGTTFASLAVIALVVERSTATLLSIWYHQETDTATRNATKAEDSLYFAYCASANVTTATIEARNTAVDSLRILENRIDTLRQAWSILLSAILSFAGARTLQQLVELKNLSSVQASLFTGLDVLLTTGLLAGGSAALNALAQSTKNTLQAHAAKANRAAAVPIVLPKN